MRMHHRVSISQPTFTQDGTGQPKITYPSSYRTCWANVMDEAGREFIRGGQVVATVAGYVEILFPRSGRVPQPEDRVTFTESAANGEARTVEVVYVKRLDARQRRLRLFFKEVA